MEINGKMLKKVLKKFDINKSLNGKALAKEISRSLICINLLEIAKTLLI